MGNLERIELTIQYVIGQRDELADNYAMSRCPNQGTIYPRTICE